MTYAELQSTILDWLNRPDLEAVVPTFIADAEARLNRDTRIRSQVARAVFTVNGDGLDLPTDYAAVDSWHLNGPTYYGALETVNGNALSVLRARYRSGPPRYVAIEERKAYFAPEPGDASYDTLLSYWRRIPALSDAATTNWFLDAHPDIYRLAALVESAPYLKDDQRTLVWETQLQARLEDLLRATEAEVYSGSLVRRFNAIGG